MTTPQPPTPTPTPRTDGTPEQPLRIAHEQWSDWVKDRFPGAYRITRDCPPFALGECVAAVHPTLPYFAHELIRRYNGYRQLEREVAALKAELAEWDNAAKFAADEKCTRDEKHCACVPLLREQLRQRDEQLKAANENAETLATQLYSLMLDGENIGVDSKLNDVIHHANRDDADAALAAHRARTGKQS